MIDVDGVPEIIFIGCGGGGGGVLKLTVEEKIKQVLRERLLHWLTFLKSKDEINVKEGCYIHLKCM